jgi:hypothetical protein
MAQWRRMGVKWRQMPLMALFLMMWLGGGSLSGQPSSAVRPAVPELVIEAPAELAAARARLRSFDTSRLAGVMRLLGIDDAGPPIRVVLSPETADVARQAPPSTAGFAIGEESLVVLFPSRSPTYPADTLEDVLHHEVAHVLITRASGGRPVPRWFHEGLAMAAERTWGLEDQARLLQEVSFVTPTPFSSLNSLFEQGEGARTRAYALSGAFVRDLMQQHGGAAPGMLLGRMAAGASFDSAFETVMGDSVAAEEAAFWDRHRFWSRWGPFFTTTTALWMGVTVLALIAIVRQRQKNAERRNRWTEDAATEDTPADDTSTDETGTE